MKSMEVNISLDPVNDGASFIKLNEKAKDIGGLILATNGESRKIGFIETIDLLGTLAKNPFGEIMGESPYIMIINADKILTFETGLYFIGSALIVKFGGEESGFEMLSDDDFEEAAKEFGSRLVTITANGQNFSAYEIYSGGAL